MNKWQNINADSGGERSVGAKAELAVALREGLEIIVQGGGEE